MSGDISKVIFYKIVETEEYSIGSSEVKVLETGGELEDITVDETINLSNQGKQSVVRISIHYTRTVHENYRLFSSFDWRGDRYQVRTATREDLRLLVTGVTEE